MNEIIFLIIHIIFSWNSDKKFHEGEIMTINDAIIKPKTLNTNRIDGI